MFNEEDSPGFKAKLEVVNQELGGPVTFDGALNLGKDIKARQEFVRNLPEAHGFGEFWNSFDKQKIEAAWKKCLEGFNVNNPKECAEYYSVNSQVKTLDSELYSNLHTGDNTLRPRVIGYVHSLENAIDTSQFFKFARALEVLRPAQMTEDFRVSKSEWDRLTGYINMLFEHSNFVEFARLYSEAVFLDFGEINRRLKITDKKWEVLVNTFRAHSANPDLRTELSMLYRAIKPKGKSGFKVTEREWLVKCKNAKDAYIWATQEGNGAVSNKGQLQNFLKRAIEAKYANVAVGK